MPLIYLFVALIAVGIAAWIANTWKPMPESITGIFNLVLALIVVGMVLWLINTYVPMAGSIRAIINIVVVVAVCVQVLRTFGLWNGIVGLWTDFKSHRMSR
jgi:predicted membrane protein